MVKISEDDVERIMLSNGSEREILCETLLGMSFSAAAPILEYEMLMSKVLAGKWMITEIDSTFQCGVCRIGLGAIDRTAAMPGKMRFELSQYQLDERFLKAMRGFAALSLGYPTPRSGKAVENTSIVKLAKSLMPAGKGEDK